jgi:hypothetical protein
VTVTAALFVTGIGFPGLPTNRARVTCAAGLVIVSFPRDSTSYRYVPPENGPVPDFQVNCRGSVVVKMLEGFNCSDVEYSRL